MQIVTDWDIQAFLDNELGAEEQEHLLKILKDDPELRERYNTLRRQRDLLCLWWKDH